MLTPSPGSKWYEDTYTSGLAFKSVNGKTIEPHIVDGNYVVASKHPRPWLKQLNLLAGYMYFFNPLRLLMALVFSRSRIPFSDSDRRPAREVQQYSRWKKIRRRIHLKLLAHLTDAGMQALGLCGLFHTVRRTLPWAWHLWRGRIERSQHSPASRIPMRSPNGQSASHHLPGTLVADSEAKVVSLQIAQYKSHSNAA